MNRSPSVLVSIAIGLIVAACSGPPGSVPGDSIAETPSASTPASPSPVVDASPSATASSPASSPALEPSASDPTAAEYRLTYDWAVPSNRVTVHHDVHAPIAPPPALPLPSLVAVSVGDHPEADPSYQRISFSFRGGFPEYTIQYVRSLTAEGSGGTIPLEGNGVLEIGFVSAQAHDNAGASTVEITPKNPIAFKNLKSYAFAGEFEGHVTYGLGIQVAPDSDQVLQVRAGELETPDSVGRTLYVVHVDIQTG